MIDLIIINTYSSLYLHKRKLGQDLQLQRQLNASIIRECLDHHSLMMEAEKISKTSNCSSTQTLLLAREDLIAKKSLTYKLKKYWNSNAVMLEDFVNSIEHRVSQRLKGLLLVLCLPISVFNRFFKTRSIPFARARTQTEGRETHVFVLGLFKKIRMLLIIVLLSIEHGDTFTAMLMDIY